MSRSYQEVSFDGLSDENMIRVRLRAYRQARNASQADISEIMGIPQTVTRFERTTDKGFTMAVAVGIANALGLHRKSAFWVDGFVETLEHDQKTASFVPRVKFLLNVGHTIDDNKARKMLLEAGL